MSVLTLQGRIVMPYTGYDKHVVLIPHGASGRAARLWLAGVSDVKAKAARLLRYAEFQGSSDPSLRRSSVE